MRVLITGGRKFYDWNLLNNTLNEFLKDKTSITIVHGDCPTGADQLAQRFVDYQRVQVERYPANWKKFGKAAGSIRNQEMVDLGADICFAFPHPESTGTWDCVEKAHAAKIEIQVKYSLLYMWPETLF
jgi:hypothetical protein